MTRVSGEVRGEASERPSCQLVIEAAAAREVGLLAPKSAADGQRQSRLPHKRPVLVRQQVAPGSVAHVHACNIRACAKVTGGSVKTTHASTVRGCNYYTLFLEGISLLYFCLNYCLRQCSHRATAWRAGQSAFDFQEATKLM